VVVIDGAGILQLLGELRLLQTNNIGVLLQQILFEALLQHSQIVPCKTDTEAGKRLVFCNEN